MSVMQNKVLRYGDDNAVCQAGDLLRPRAGFAAARCLVFTHVWLEGFYPLLSSHCVNIVALPLLALPTIPPPPSFCQQRSLTAPSGTAPRLPPSGSVPRGPGPARWREVG